MFVGRKSWLTATARLPRALSSPARLFWRLCYFGSRSGDGLEVEFGTASGRTPALYSLRQTDVRLLRDDDCVSCEG